jgi:hypothetical protein
VLAIALAIAFFLVQAKVDLLSLSTKYVVINAVLAILGSLAATILSLVGYCYVDGLGGKAWRKLLVRITLYTLARAFGRYSEPVQATGIGPRQGSVVIRLAVGVIGSVGVGDKFDVLNAATLEKWGMLEVIEVEDASCVCRVSDRINISFWHELEQRMERDPSQPAGVTFSRETPPGFLDFVRRLVRTWGV